MAPPQCLLAQGKSIRCRGADIMDKGHKAECHKNLCKKRAIGSPVSTAARLALRSSAWLCWSFSSFLLVSRIDVGTPYCLLPHWLDLSFTSSPAACLSPHGMQLDAAEKYKQHPHQRFNRQSRSPLTTPADAASFIIILGFVWRVTAP